MSGHSDGCELGQLALEESLLKSDQLAKGARLQATSGDRLGEILIQFGYLNEVQVSFLRERLLTKRTARERLSRKELIFTRMAVDLHMISEAQADAAIAERVLREAEGLDQSVGEVMVLMKFLTQFQWLKLQTQGRALLYCPECGIPFSVEGWAPGYQIRCLSCRTTLVEAPEGVETDDVPELFFDQRRADELAAYGRQLLKNNDCTREELSRAAQHQACNCPTDGIGDVLVELGTINRSRRNEIEAYLSGERERAQTGKRILLRRLAFGEICLKLGYMHIPILRPLLNRQKQLKVQGQQRLLGSLMVDERVLTRFQLERVLEIQNKQLVGCTDCFKQFNIVADRPAPDCPECGKALAKPDPIEVVEIFRDLAAEAQSASAEALEVDEEAPLADPVPTTRDEAPGPKVRPLTVKRTKKQISARRAKTAPAPAKPARPNPLADGRPRKLDSEVRIKFNCKCGKRLRLAVKLLSVPSRCPKCSTSVIAPSPTDSSILDVLCVCGTPLDGDQPACGECGLMLFSWAESSDEQPLDLLEDMPPGYETAEVKVSADSNLLKVIDIRSDESGVNVKIARARDNLTEAYDHAAEARRPKRRPPSAVTLASGSASLLESVEDPAGRGGVGVVGILLIAGVVLGGGYFGFDYLTRTPPPRDKPSAKNVEPAIDRPAPEALRTNDEVELWGEIPWGEGYVVRNKEQQGFMLRTADGKHWWVVDLTGKSFHALQSRVKDVSKDVPFRVRVNASVADGEVLRLPDGSELEPVQVLVLTAKRWERMATLPNGPYLRRTRKASSP